MKSIAKCWKPQAVALLIATILLVGCATVSSDTQAICPPIVEYNTADQIRAAVELEALPDGAIVVRMLSDYAVLRNQARTCR